MSEVIQKIAKTRWDSRQNANKILRMLVPRLICGLFGLILVWGGLLAGSYIPTDFEGFTTAASAAIGILVPAMLMLSAFYLAFRLLKFAALARK